MAGLLDSRAQMPPQVLDAYLKRQKGLLNNQPDSTDFYKGGISGLLGLPADLTQLGASIWSAGMRPGAPAPEIPYTTDRIGGLLGADTDSAGFIAGSIGAPDPRDALKAIGLLGLNSPEFARMFARSKLVDDSGAPRKLLHGSTGDIERFDLDLANPESDWGAGIYMTSSVDDVNANYAGFGPDLTQKIELEAERIADRINDIDIEYGGESFYEQAEALLGKDPIDASADEIEAISKQIAKNRLASTNQGQITPLYAAIENPAVSGGPNETVFDIVSEFDDDGDIIDEGGTLLEFIDSLRNVQHRFSDLDVDQFASELLEAADYDSIRLSDIHRLSKESEGLRYATDEQGRMVSGDVLRQALEDMGFDGIIDHTVNEKFGAARRIGQPMEGVDADTFHVIAFDPDKLNTAIAGQK